MSSDENAKLTKRTVDAIRPPETGFVRVWDKELKGFYIRVRANGRKTYELRYRIGRRQSSIAIGDHGPFTPEQARDEAEEHKRNARRGIDPLTARKAARDALTVSDTIGRYLIEGPAANPNKRAASWRTDATNLRRHVEPLIGPRPVRELTPADLERWQKDVTNGKTARAEPKREKGDKSRTPRSRSMVRGGRGAATRAMQSLSAMLGWAARADVAIIAENPARKVAKFTARKMQRFLAPEEASRLWDAIDSLESGVVPSAAVQMTAGPGAEERVDPRRAARIVKLSPATLSTYRTKGGGPPFLKKQGRISYRVGDLLEWSLGTRQARAATQAIRPDEADLFRLLGLTGARLSEIKNLMLHEIDWTRAMLVIRPDRHKSGALTGDERIVHLPDAAVEILRRRKAAIAHRRRQSASNVVALRSGESSRLNASGASFVFPREDGRAPISPPKVAWARVQKVASLPGLRIHDLRHSLASFMLADGVPLALVGKALGHKKASTTERYAHLAPDAAAASVRKVASVWTTPAARSESD